ESGGVSFLGRPILYTDAASFLSAWHDIFVCRMYEIIPPSGRSPRLIDAGANLGLAALFWRNRYGKFDYVGFEPDPKLADVACQNLRAWGCEGQLHQVAVAAGP